MIWTDTTVVLFNRDGHQVQWRWDPQATDPTTVEMELLRAEGPKGPWDVLVTFDPRVMFSYFDMVSPNRPQQQEIYYALRAVTKATGVIAGMSRPFNTNGYLTQDALWIIEQQRYLLEGVNGHPPINGVPGLVSIYRKRNFGETCPECVDAITGRTMVSNCRLCSGTGKLDGYYKPVDVGMKIMPDSISTRLFNLQKTEDSDTTGVMNNFPVMYPGDIVVEPSEKHWIVTKVEVRERHRTLVRQILYLSQAKPDDVIHETLRHSSHGGKLF